MTKPEQWLPPGIASDWLDLGIGFGIAPALVEHAVAAQIDQRLWLLDNTHVLRNENAAARRLFRALVRLTRAQERIFQRWERDGQVREFYRCCARIAELRKDLDAILVADELRRSKEQKRTAQQLQAELRRAATLARVQRLAEKHLVDVEPNKQISVLQNAWPKRRKRLSDHQLRKYLTELGLRR